MSSLLSSRVFRALAGTALILFMVSVVAAGAFWHASEILELSRQDDGYKTLSVPSAHKLFQTTPDTAQWIVQTDSMRANDVHRLRTVVNDNAPQGRPDEWSSPAHWLLSGMASVCGTLGILPDFSPVEAAAVVTGPVLLCLFLIAPPSRCGGSGDCGRCPVLRRR